MMALKVISSPDMRTEKQIQSAIVEVLKLLKIPYTISDVGLMRDKNSEYRYKRGTKGWSDISAVLPDGKFLAIEVKTSTGKLSKEQQEMHDILRKSHAEVIVARSASAVYDFIKQYQTV